MTILFFIYVPIVGDFYDDVNLCLCSAELDSQKES